MPLPTPQSASGSARGDLRESSPSARRWNSIIIFCGGGPGAAFAGEVNAQAPGLIWSRADKDGRSVMAIDIMALPEPGVPFAWEWGLSMQAQEVRLTSAVPSDPHMEALVAGKAAR